MTKIVKASNMQTPAILSSDLLKQYWQPRPADFHKGQAGHVLIVGGDYGYSGAVHLAAEAALRVGAGLVSVVTRNAHAKLINLARPEIMAHSRQKLAVLLEKATVIVLGPGLGQAKWGRELFDQVMQAAQPILVDADGLNILAQAPRQRSNWILTPHPGEAARLLDSSSALIQMDRLNAISALQTKFGGTVVLKGCGSLVMDAEQLLSICQYGNPGMATAGMGDVLSGVIAGIMAQGLEANNAAKLGVLIHAMAGDKAAQNGQRGMLASDLMPYLRELVN
jgi:hydroxyethylthiazole kinase-like uncharacterized protein yjeF